MALDAREIVIGAGQWAESELTVTLHWAEGLITEQEAESRKQVEFGVIVMERTTNSSRAGLALPVCIVPKVKPGLASVRIAGARTG